MKFIQIHARSFFLCLLWTFALSVPHPASGQTKLRENAQAILENVKHAEYQREMAIRQTQLDRLKEDFEKGKERAYGVEKLIASLSADLKDSNARLEQLTAQRKQQPKVLEVISLQLEAENARVEGLNMLESAQKKALDALAKRNEATDQRTTLSAMEMKVFAERTLPGLANTEIGKRGPKEEPSVAELRKKLEKADRAANNAESLARDAMKSASLRLQQADNASEKAEKRRIELGFDESLKPISAAHSEPPTENPSRKQRSKP